MKVSMKGFGFYIITIFLILFLVTYISDVMQANEEKYGMKDYYTDLEAGNIVGISVYPNEETPTGEVRVVLKNSGSDSDIRVFYVTDVSEYSKSTRYAPKEGTPENSFNISMVPWLEFTAVNINVFDDGKFLLPIFTMGKCFERDGRRLLPLAIQAHHAVCDGYHVGLFVEKLQNEINRFHLY